MIKEYKNISKVKGPIIVVKNIKNVSYNELVKIKTGGEVKSGQVLEISKDYAVVQVFEGTTGINSTNTKVKFLGEPVTFGVSKDVLGRTFNGSGKIIDGKEDYNYNKKMDINGNVINPIKREYPSEFIQTGIPAIDIMNTLVRGQKLPIFSCAGLNQNQLAVQIARNSKILGKNENFAVVFAAMGITNEEAIFFKENLSFNKNVSLFLNLASDPTIEQIITPRIALTAAEYLAYECDMHVLVILTDMTNYCDALCEVSSSRSEIPARRGYPGYLYSDLSTIYERAGKLKYKRGSITQIPILTMPDDDITHPVPDLTGYITEGQIVLSRQLYNLGIYPPINVLPSLSRLMKKGIGKDKTRIDHKEVSDQLYSIYSKGLEVKSLVSVVGKESLSDTDLKYLEMVDVFEKEFLSLNFDDDYKVEDSLKIGWSIFSKMPQKELKKLSIENIKKYLK